jgi:hypothetical protein
MNGKNEDKKNKKQTSYTIEDAIKIADDVLQISKDKEYNLGAFIHGLTFALEYAIYSYKIPQQQIATIKRDCRKYLNEMEKIKAK